ncbi:MAG: hypothetical protein LIP01_07365 [Tannerellaceae bacterium]|nr:hypothetical protein [Tannerellaceae bacterium]
MVYTFFSIFLGPVSSLGIWYVAHITRCKKYTGIFVISFLLQIAAFFCLFTLDEDSFLLAPTVFLLGVTWLISVVFMAVKSGEVLRALSFSAPVTEEVPDVVEVPDAKEIGSQLIQNLTKWRGEIESIEMQQDITQLIKSCEIILTRNDEESLKFF